MCWVGRSGEDVGGGVGGELRPLLMTHISE
jgi:hypothetical protein